MCNMATAFQAPLAQSTACASSNKRHEQCWCRSRLKGVLMEWDPNVKPDASLVNLGTAFVQRLARDSSILQLQPEELGQARQAGGKHKCLGCPQCCGPVWQFKTEIVASLWAILCKQCLSWYSFTWQMRILTLSLLQWSQHMSKLLHQTGQVTAAVCTCFCCGSLALKSLGTTCFYL